MDDESFEDISTIFANKPAELDFHMNNPYSPVLRNILLHLDYEDLQNYQNVCKTWKYLIDNPKLWLEIYHKNGLSYKLVKEWTKFIQEVKVKDNSRTSKLEPVVTMLLMAEHRRETKIFHSPLFSILDFASDNWDSNINCLFKMLDPTIQYLMSHKHLSIIMEYKDSTGKMRYQMKGFANGKVIQLITHPDDLQKIKQFYLMSQGDL